MSLVEPFAAVEADYRSRVMHATWGHLAPEPRKQYAGEILFAHGCYGDAAVIHCEFEELSDSPWFYEHLNDFVADKAFERPRGALLRFTGTYMMFKNGKSRFSGKVRRVSVK
ncbi:hypothetical protein [Cupriavidus metallidurans]|uniref:hypothetical protein n=1 Tax=Cupriavidus metallidurans TaxID=119219 RepID=UPI001CCF89E1|nr:hypothetical protein [Cupriavidus metallidurans]UBM12721.1 hypothetical protein LAI70_28320 [Cupriavidus metallidurans]